AFQQQLVRPESQVSTDTDYGSGHWQGSIATINRGILAKTSAKVSYNNSKGLTTNDETNGVNLGYSEPAHRVGGATDQKVARESGSHNEVVEANPSQRERVGGTADHKKSNGMPISGLPQRLARPPASEYGMAVKTSTRAVESLSAFQRTQTEESSHRVGAKSGLGGKTGAEPKQVERSLYAGSRATKAATRGSDGMIVRADGCKELAHADSDAHCQESRRVVRSAEGLCHENRDGQRDIVPWILRIQMLLLPILGKQSQVKGSANTYLEEMIQDCGRTDDDPNGGVISSDRTCEIKARLRAVWGDSGAASSVMKGSFEVTTARSRIVRPRDDKNGGMRLALKVGRADIGIQRLDKKRPTSLAEIQDCGHGRASKVIHYRLMCGVQGKLRSKVLLQRAHEKYQRAFQQRLVPFPYTVSACQRRPNYSKSNGAAEELVARFSTDSATIHRKDWGKLAKLNVMLMGSSQG
ncbi:hypothetical protein B0H17DRAFT_1145984, partial [Mycena rosella]